MYRKIIIIVVILIFIITPIIGLSDEVKLRKAIPFGILNRVFQIEYLNKKGTCFVIDVDQRQYIITARHLIPNGSTISDVKISIAGKWFSFKAKVIYPDNFKTDIVALVTEKAIAPKMDILVGSGDIFLGQDVYFLGFPFGLHSEAKGLFPIKVAFAKKGILSAMDTNDASGNIIYIDGHNNPGFSGGPVIFANLNKNERLQIAGVISGYKNQPLQVNEVEIDVKDSDTANEGKKVVHYVLENTGIVVAYNIKEILEAISKNPIGPLVPEQNNSKP
jgi:hypothetical protein